MPKLVLGLRLAGKQVAVWVIHQDESLRGAGTLWQKDDLKISSTAFSSLLLNFFHGSRLAPAEQVIAEQKYGYVPWIDTVREVELFVRGTDTFFDNHTCICSFPTEDHARHICDLIREGVKAINNREGVRAINVEPVQTPTGAFAGFEVVE